MLTHFSCPVPSGVGCSFVCWLAWPRVQQWYCRFYLGRRCHDDERQVSRGLKVRLSLKDNRCDGQRCGIHVPHWLLCARLGIRLYSSCVRISAQRVTCNGCVNILPLHRCGSVVSECVLYSHIFWTSFTPLGWVHAPTGVTKEFFFLGFHLRCLP